jgi:antitoxin (DNA-binding transcriptional repressor) of toxin-antitoxin stability system
MKTISIRELHERTGQWVRDAHRHGEIVITDRGQAVAKILPEATPPKVPFSKRKLLPGFAKLEASGKLRGGTDSTIGISEDREDRI